MVPYNSERPVIGNSQNFASKRRKFFTKFTLKKAIFYCGVAMYWSVFAIICIAEMFLTDSMICDEASIPANELAKAKIMYKNPSFIYKPCEHMPLPHLLYLSRLQCNFGRRLLASGFLGGIVGWERREADRPAGIRTMALVSLGVCLFSIDSMYSFWDGPMGWDSSRVSAAIPSGVGFLGAGMIFKDAQKNDNSGAITHVVHGLTTSASLWVSAAIGMACAGELYFAATFTVATILILLRFGPRQLSEGFDEPKEGEDDELDEMQVNSIRSIIQEDDNERAPLQRKSTMRSLRVRAALGGIV